MAFHDAPGPDRVMFCSVGYARGPETRVYMDGSDAGLSRGEVVAALNGWVVDKDTIAELRARIAALEAQLDRYRWRRVEEEMPQAFEGVIVAGPDRRTEAFIDEQGRWRWGGTANIIREFVPTHWMPLPPAPEEGE